VTISVADIHTLTCTHTHTHIYLHTFFSLPVLHTYTHCDTPGRMKSLGGYGFRFADEKDRDSVVAKARHGGVRRSRQAGGGAGGNGKSVEQFDFETGESIQVGGLADDGLCLCVCVCLCV
jgi:hypothetical protein